MIMLIALIVAIVASAAAAIPLGVRRDGIPWRSREFWLS